MNDFVIQNACVTCNDTVIKELHWKSSRSIYPKLLASVTSFIMPYHNRAKTISLFKIQSETKTSTFSTTNFTSKLQGPRVEIYVNVWIFEQKFEFCPCVLSARCKECIFNLVTYKLRRQFQEMNLQIIIFQTWKFWKLSYLYFHLRDFTNIFGRPCLYR